MDNVNEPLLPQGSAPAATAAPPSALADSAAPAPEQNNFAQLQTPYQPGGAGPYQPGGAGPYQPGGPGAYQPGGPGAYQPGPYQQQQPYQPGPYQQQQQQQPYQQQAPFPQQAPFQPLQKQPYQQPAGLYQPPPFQPGGPGPYQPGPYQQPSFQPGPYQPPPFQPGPYQPYQPQPYGSASTVVPSTAYGGAGAATSYNNNASSASLNVGSQVVGSAAPLPPPVTVESLYQEYDRVRTAVLVLTIIQCVLWFPLGLLFLECYDEVGRGRRHWTMGAFFFALSLVTCATLTAFFYIVGIFLLPHIIVSAVCMAKGKEMDYLEKALRLVDDHGFLMRYSPARTQTVVVAN